jgi:hypothetical protein
LSVWRTTTVTSAVSAVIEPNRTTRRANHPSLFIQSAI